jgi:hypothetical protein
MGLASPQVKSGARPAVVSTSSGLTPQTTRPRPMRRSMGGRRQRSPEAQTERADFRVAVGITLKARRASRWWANHRHPLLDQRSNAGRRRGVIVPAPGISPAGSGSTRAR